MKYTFETDETHEAEAWLRDIGLDSEVDRFLTFLMGYDKHKDLTPDAEKVLEDVRKAARHMKGAS